MCRCVLPPADLCYHSSHWNFPDPIINILMDVRQTQASVTCVCPLYNNANIVPLYFSLFSLRPKQTGTNKELEWNLQQGNNNLLWNWGALAGLFFCCGNKVFLKAIQSNRSCVSKSCFFFTEGSSFWYTGTGRMERWCNDSSWDVSGDERVLKASLTPAASHKRRCTSSKAGRL